MMREVKLLGVKRVRTSGGLGTLSAMGLLLSACGGGSSGGGGSTADTTPPALANKKVEVKTVDGEAGARELVATFSENVKLKDAGKVKLVRTHGDDGTELSTEENIDVPTGDVKASGKTVSVKFTPSGHSKYKLVFESGSVEDDAGNAFTPADVPAGTTDDVDALNKAPVFGASLGSTVNANEGVGGVLGTYGATDADGDTLTYSLEGTNADLFNVNSASGLVSWKTFAPAHGSSNEYSFTVVAKDAFGGETRHEVTVTVVEVTGVLPPQQVELYDEDAPTTPITGLTNKKKLKVLKVVVSQALASGDSVEFFDGTTSLGKTTLDAPVVLGGKVTLTLGTALSVNREYVLTAKVTIATGANAGTSGGSTSLTFTLDTVSPDIPDTPILSLGGGVSKDGVSYTRSGVPTFEVTGLETGSTVKLYKDVRGTLTEIGSGVVLRGDSVQLVANLGGEGDYHVVAREIDLAGNESELSSALSVKVDKTAPLKPTLALEGESSARPTLRVSGVEEGSTVILYSKAGNGDLTEIGRGTATGTTIDITVQGRLPEGKSTIVGRVVDIAGNEGEVSSDFSMTVSVSISLILRSGTPEGYGYGEPKFVVEALRGDRVAIYKKGGVRLSSEKVIGLSGKVFFDFSELTNGGEVLRGNELEARVTGGDKSSSVTLSGLDTVSPTPVSNSLTATVNEVYLTLTFDEALGYVLDKSKFTVSGGNVRYVTIDSADATKVRIVLTLPVTAKAYTVGWEEGAIADRAGNEVAATSTPLEVTASAAESDTTAPILAWEGYSPATASSPEFYFPINVDDGVGAYTVSIYFNEKLQTGTASTARLTLGSEGNIQFFRLGEDAQGAETETLVLVSSAPSLKQVLSTGFQLLWLTKPKNLLVEGFEYRLKVKANTVYDSGGTGNEAISYDFRSGVHGDAISLSTTGDEGLTIVDGETLRINFGDDVELGYYAGGIRLEKKSGEVYEEVLGDFELSTSGKGLTMILGTSLEVGGEYRVKLSANVVRKVGNIQTSPYVLTTESDRYTVSASDGDDFVGLGVASDADYGF